MITAWRSHPSTPCSASTNGRMPARKRRIPNLSGCVGRIIGTVIGTIILGVVTSGFTFLKVGAYCQEIVKG